MNAGAFKGMVIGVTFGALWGALSAILVGLLATLVLGAQVGLSVWPALVAGGLGAAVWLFMEGRVPARGPRLGVASAVFAAALWGAASGAPFGLTAGVVPLGMLAMLGLVATLAMGIVALIFGGRDWRALNRYRLEEVLIRGLKAFGFLFFISIVFLPFYAMVMTSLKKQAELLLNPLDYSIDFAQGFTALFSSYIELFTTFDFGRFVLVSLTVSVVTVVLTLMASIPGAYAISRLNFPGRRLFSRSILLIYMVPAIVLVIPLYAVFSQLGLRDTLLGLVLIYPATTIPVALYMLQGYFRGIPAELEEAGLMDGCSRLKVIWKITLPLSLPAIASVSLYVFMIAWNEFLFAFMFLDTPEIFTLPRAVVSLNSSEVPRQHLMAGAVIVTIPVLVLFLWFERFLVSGLTAGSVKG